MDPPPSWKQPEPRESMHLGDLRVNDVMKGIGDMKMSDVMKGIGPMPGSEMADVMKRIERLPYVAIPIEELEKELAEELAKELEDSDAVYTLFRVPEWVRDVSPDAPYYPKFICIGPCHRGKNGNPLRQEKLKKKYVYRLWEFYTPDIKDCLAKLREEKEKTRRFYSETFDDINDEDWAMMLLLDGCFVVMHLLDFSANTGHEFPTNWEKTQVKIDLALLENQLPFFILEKIFDLFFPYNKREWIADKSTSCVLRGMAVQFWVTKQDEDFVTMKNVMEEATTVYHLVHLIHLAHGDLIDTATKVPKPTTVCRTLYWTIIKLWTVIKKAFWFCPIILMMVLTCCKDDVKTEETWAECSFFTCDSTSRHYLMVQEALVEDVKQALKDVENVAKEADKAAGGKKAADMEKEVVTMKNVAADMEKAEAKAKNVAADMEKAEAKAKKVVDDLNKARRTAEEEATKNVEAAKEVQAAAAKVKAAADAWNLVLEYGSEDEAARKAVKEARKAVDEADEAVVKKMRPKENIASAMNLHSLGIQFVTTKSVGGSEYHVRLSSNDEDMLVIPPMMVSGTTAPLLHNLIALEQQHQGEGQRIRDHFTKYAFLMYNLINSHEDIDLLQKRGILLNNYGTDEQLISYFKNLLLWNSRLPEESRPKDQTPCEQVMEFFKNLNPCCRKRQETMAITRVLDVLAARSKHRAYRDWAQAVQYCNSPVNFLLLVTSIVVFVSTILQTVTSFGH